MSRRRGVMGYRTGQGGGIPVACVLLAMCALSGLSGCAAAPLHMQVRPSDLRVHPRVAMLPLENLSGRADASGVLSRIFFTELVRKGSCDVVEAGEVDAALEELRVLNSGSISVAQLEELGQKLKADLVLTGSVLESGVRRAQNGTDVPSVGAALKLLDARTGKVVWAAMDVRSGDDRETVFGWGTRHDYQQLAQELAIGLLDGFPAIPAGPEAGSAGGAHR